MLLALYVSGRTMLDMGGAVFILSTFATIRATHHLPNYFSFSGKRSLHVDVAKGIAMLGIVAIHNPMLLKHGGGVFDALLAFALPVFFVATGMFIREDAQWRDVIATRSRSLLLPYAAVVIAQALWQMPLSMSRAAQTVSGALYASGATVPWVTLWFLPHLWLVSILAYVVTRLTRRVAYRRAICGLAAIALIATGSWALHQFDRPDAPAQLPWSIDLLPLSLAFVLAGHVCRRFLLTLRPNSWLILCVAAAFVFVQALPGSSMDLNLRRYDNAGLTTLSALLGCYLVYSIASLIGDVPGVGRTMSAIGRASLIVCIVHFPVQQLLLQHAGHAPMHPTMLLAASLSVVSVGISMLVNYAIQCSSRLNWRRHKVYERSFSNF
ncbi:acyltransferase family protein [Paraburkholderia kirstenboschensis]|uniref:acyltransferase family protein n=1 Tax=Paraburkholderia kirstenboschensis TaxID=1245436 RepID=UPI0013E38EB4|nr:acyltransferase [Paraburkholderia kirstenboschensis]